MPWLERAYLASHFHDVAVNSALAMLGAIASGMRALAAIAFAIVYITVQFRYVGVS